MSLLLALLLVPAERTDGMTILQAACIPASFSMHEEKISWGCILQCRITLTGRAGAAERWDSLCWLYGINVQSLSWQV